MTIGALGKAGRQILGAAKARNVGVKKDIVAKEKKLTATERKLEVAKNELKNKRQAAENLKKSTNTKQRIKAGQKVVKVKGQINRLEERISILVDAIKGNVKRTYGAKQTPDWQRTSKSGDVEATAGITSRKSTGQREHVGPRKKGGQVKTTYRAGGGLVSKGKTMHGYREGGQV